MGNWLNLLEETKMHFAEGAKSVKAHMEDRAFIITKASDGEYNITWEEPGFPKTKTSGLEEFFVNVFGIEARY